MGSSCSLTQLIFVLSSQGLFLSSLLISLLPDLFWPRACTWGMLEEWSAVLWERITTNAVCLQLPQPCSSDLNRLSKTVDGNSYKSVTWFQEADFGAERTTETHPHDDSRPSFCWKEFWRAYRGRAWQITLPVKKPRTMWMGPTHLGSSWAPVSHRSCLGDSWRPGWRAQGALAGAQNEPTLGCWSPRDPGSDLHVSKPQFLRVWQ